MRLAGFIILMVGLVWCACVGLLAIFDRQGLSWGVPYQRGRPDAADRQAANDRSVASSSKQLRVMKAGIPIAVIAIVVGVALLAI